VAKPRASEACHFQKSNTNTYLHNGHILYHPKQGGLKDSGAESLKEVLGGAQSWEDLNEIRIMIAVDLEPLRNLLLAPETIWIFKNVQFARA